MSYQKFRATERHAFANGAIGWRPGGPFDCLGPFAKVENCPIEGTDLRRTVYATGYPDTFFSVPACTRYRGRYIGGYLTCRDDAVEFIPHDRFLPLLPWRSSESIRAAVRERLRRQGYALELVPIPHSQYSDRAWFRVTAENLDGLPPAIIDSLARDWRIIRERSE